MRIAIPVTEGRLSADFGQCDCFAILDADPATMEIARREDLKVLPHQPELLPPQLAERGVNAIIAARMDSQVRKRFVELDIHVVVGAPTEVPECLVRAWLAGALQPGENNHGN